MLGGFAQFLNRPQTLMNYSSRNRPIEKTMHRGLTLSTVILILSTCLMVGGAFASEPSSPQGTVTREVTAGIIVTEEYNDNIYAERTRKIADAIAVISPAINFRVASKQGRLNFGAIAEFGNYANYQDENYRDYRVYADGLYRLRPDFSLAGGASYAREHEDRTSIEDVNQLDPVIFYAARAYAAAGLKFDRTTVQLGATFDDFDFEEFDDRDRSVVTAGIRVGYRRNLKTEVYLNGRADFREYRQESDFEGYKRSSSGVRIAVGAKHRFSKSLSGELYGGWIYQSFDDARFSDVSTPDFGGELRWTPAPGLTILGSVNRRLYDTTIEGSSSYVQSVASLRLYKWMRPNLRLNAGFNYYDGDFQDIDRRDATVQFSLGLRRYVAPHIYFGAGYTYTSRDSTVIGESYDRSVFMLRVGRTKDPAYAPKDLKAANVAPVKRNGFYFGVRAGQLTPQTKLEGERGNGGSLEADFGDAGFGGAVFAGYGIDVGNWFMALEGDVGKANAGWDHARLPGGRVFSVDREEAYGISALFGRYMPGGGKIFGRAGAVFEKYRTQYQTPNNSFRTSDRDFGLRFGIGASLPVSPHLSVRLEHTYSMFGDYRIGPPREPDRFANDVAATWLSLAYSFHAASIPVDALENLKLSGAYVGVGAAHGSMGSRTTGDRQDDSVLTADFSDAGLTGGVFAGYGFQRGRFFGAAEVELAYSDATWDHERDPTGRDFSLTKRETIGAGLRVGFLTRQAGLIYASVGVVRTGFDMNYERGESVISKKDHATGIRYGLGLELPANHNVWFRFDYTFTDYEGLKLETLPDNGTETYDTQESMFRVGTVFRY